VATAATAQLPAKVGVRTMEVMEIDFQATPFRAEKFFELYEPAAARVLAYGASGYFLYRFEDDPDHFVHISFWDNRSDFDRYWFSSEIQEVRRNLSGYYEQPVLPHWAALYSRG
jgi:quinol monooxygenase YgiN